MILYLSAVSIKGIEFLWLFTTVDVQYTRLNLTIVAFYTMKTPLNSSGQEALSQRFKCIILTVTGITVLFNDVSVCEYNFLHWLAPVKHKTWHID